MNIKKDHESGQISVSIIKDSVSECGDRITTFELEYPRFIHSELMTHRMFSRNAMSSRAVPVKRMIEQVRNNPAMPIHWGKNQGGMQADAELSEQQKETVIKYWIDSAASACEIAEFMSVESAHKQVVNRILEPYQRMKTIVTATEYGNFFGLRCHKDAQPEIKALAELMSDCMGESAPDKLKAGEWHIPYVEIGGDGFFVMEGDLAYPLSLEDALKVSASCCAQVSYRLLDNSVSKAIMVYDKLVESEPVHASPFEHQAKVVREWEFDCRYPDLKPEEGITHTDFSGCYWSGNFKGWIQYRHLL